MLGNDPLWYKDAIIYEVHVKAFYDSNGDGIGDFRGLAAKLDYLQDLGVNTIWLLPFYPSPMRDDGYDISDYRNIHPDYGSRKDFRHFVREAHGRNLRVITELVINHTSDQHPWFQAARRAPRGSAKRNYYLWSDTDTKFAKARVIFTDTETSNWGWDPLARQYYWHRFFSHQPDLNHDNPNVVRAVMRVMRFWLDIGVDGMRLDAIPYLCVREGTNGENLPETHEVLKRMRAELDAHYRNRMFLAEANQWPEDVRPYFGHGDECHMAYHFPLMPRIYMALAQENCYPIVEILRQTPEIPESCQWASFLRNHDELTLEMVTDRERDYMYQVYAADPRMRLNLGIRRRLAPLMGNDRSKIELLNSLLMSLIGSPILYYGDEIGMGDNIYLGDRNGVRTPMQWSSDRNAGFSTADPQRLFLPPIMDPVYGYQGVNVEAQLRSPSSLLNWMRRLIAARKAYPVLGRGHLELLTPGNRKILAYIRESGDQAILCVANLSHSPQPVELDLARYKGRVPVELMGRTPFPPIGDLPYLLTLAGYGFYWFRLASDVDVPPWHEDLPLPAQLPILVLFEGWRTLLPETLGGVSAVYSLMADKVRTQLEHEVLPVFLPGQRWYAAKGETIERLALKEQTEWVEGDGNWLLSLLEVTPADADSQLYFLPLSLAFGDLDDETIHPLLHWTLARVRRGSRTGVLYDAFGDESFCRAFLNAVAEQRKLPFGEGELRFSASSALGDLGTEISPGWAVRRVGVEQSNTSVILGERLVLKGYRRLTVGTNPELEMGRFLTEVAGFPNVAPVLGALEYYRADGAVITLALLQALVASEGDGWSYTQDYLERSLERYALGSMGEPPAEPPEGLHAAFTALIRRLGVRTGQMHAALTATTGDSAFDPEPVSPRDLRAWGERISMDLTHTLSMLEQHHSLVPEWMGDIARELVNRTEFLRRAAEALVPTQVGAVKIRCHGDYHLGQVLVAGNDFVIIDFEGEPARPLSERRQKHCALKDVAGMLRSLDYAAHAALSRLAAVRPEDRLRLEPFVRSWCVLCRDAFLAGYRDGVDGAGCYPADAAHAERLIALFTLEKTLYELRYELGNRPDWVDIPLRGILDFLSAPKPASHD